jgi:CheY-like chemotaxis protein
LLDAGQVVHNAIEQVRPLIEARRHRLALRMPREAVFIHGDQKRLVQIVANVLNNAAKYTPEGGDIVLEMLADEDKVTYSISDNGIGMAQHMIEHVFDMFAQAERSSDRSQGGLGIGLALVHNLVTLHGGQVAASSEGIGRGSRFTITLPRAVQPAGKAAPNQHGAAAAPAQALHLLVVDDNEDAGQMLGLYLESAGYQVTVTHSARAALAAAATDPPDVFLLDIGLPDMDGNELARCLRRMPHSAPAKLIAVTGYGQEADRARTAAAGFDHHFVKPVDMAPLLDVLAHAPRINAA